MAGVGVTAEGVAAKKVKAAAMPSVKTITWLTMCFMTVSAVGSIRNTPSMAVYGLACIFLYVLPAIVFLLPTSLIAAELASGWDGGVYTAAVIVIIYWVSTMVSMRGVGLVARLSSSSMLLGTAIPGSALVILGIIYLLQGNPSAAPITASALLPQFAGLASLVLIVNNFLSYAGMEVNAVHVKSMKDPAKEFPKAMFLAMGLVVIIFVLPALAISWVVPSAELTLTGGVMQAFTAFFAYFNVAWLTPILGIMLVTASLGGMMAWLAGPSKGLLQIGRQEGYLPPFFQKVNAAGIQVNILFVQGAIVTVIALLFALIPDVSSVYWIFSVITTQVYLIMYFLMFIAAMRLRRSQPDHPRGYRVPLLPVLAVVGLASSATAFAIGFVPSSQFGGGSAYLYAAIIGGGLVLLGLVAPFAFLKLRKPSWKNAVPAPDADAQG